MVLITLINISLDISANISWWLLTTGCKYTLYGTYYLITTIKPPKPTKEEIELMELRNEIGQLNRQLHLINSIHNNQHIVSRNQLMFDEPPDILDDDFTMIENHTE